MDNIRKTDSFPKSIVRTSPEKTHYNLSRLKEIQGFKQVISFICYLINDIVYSNVYTGEWSRKRELNLKQLAKDCGDYHENEKIHTWIKKSKILHSIRTEGNVYCDRKLCYVYDQHYFLVRATFTFGLRTVEPGTVHLYQITKVPLQLYIRPVNYQKKKLKMKERVLPASDQSCYKHLTLKTDTAYKIPSGTKYIIFASNKAYFSIHVMPDNMKTPYKTLNPIEEWTAERLQERKASLYERPPPTPYMMDALQRHEGTSNENPAEQPLFTLPAEQPLFTLPAEQPLFTLPAQQPLFTLPAEQPVFTLPAEQPLFTLPADAQQPAAVAEQPLFTLPDVTIPLMSPPAAVAEPQVSTLHFNYTLEREVKTVPLNFIKWYHTMKERQNESPPNHKYFFATPEGFDLKMQEEAIDYSQSTMEDLDENMKDFDNWLNELCTM